MSSPLANTVFRRLFAAQVIALAGTGLTTIALALLAYNLAGDDAGYVLGTALTLKMIAYVGIAPLVGALVDRLPRKRLLIFLDIARAGLVLCLPFVDAIWQIYVLIFCLNACSAGFTPTFQATIPDVLTDQAQYTKALSLSRLAYDLENLLSPTIAALLLTVVAYPAFFAVNAATFMVSAALVLSVRLPAPPPSERTADFIANLTFGIRSYLATPRLRGLLLLSFAVAGAGAMVIVNTVVYVRGTLGGSETATAVAMAAVGAGSIVAALSLPRLLAAVAQRTLMIADDRRRGADGIGPWVGIGGARLRGPARAVVRSGAGIVVGDDPGWAVAARLVPTVRPAVLLRRPIRAVPRLLAADVPPGRLARRGHVPDFCLWRPGRAGGGRHLRRRPRMAGRGQRRDRAQP
jgi:MFS family permease